MCIRDSSGAAFEKFSSGSHDDTIKPEALEAVENESGRIRAWRKFVTMSEGGKMIPVFRFSARYKSRDKI